MSQRELLVHTLEQSTSGNNTSSHKGSGKFASSLESVVKYLTLDANTLFPPFFLIIEIFNYNVHNFLVDSGASANIIPLSIAKKINVKWEKIDAQII